MDRFSRLIQVFFTDLPAQMPVFRTAIPDHARIVEKAGQQKILCIARTDRDPGMFQFTDETGGIPPDPQVMIVIV